jgi:hypothetical protein
MGRFWKSIAFHARESKTVSRNINKNDDPRIAAFRGTPGKT